MAVQSPAPGDRSDSSAIDPRPAWLGADLFPFRSRWIEAVGHRIHYVDEGQGDIAIVMLHGNPTWSFLYRNVILGLRRHFRCVAIDYPGFGLSSAAPGYDWLPESHANVVSHVVGRLGLRKIVWMVQDWGGPIGFSAASRMPLQTEGFVILNTWAWPLNGDFHFTWFSRLFGGALGRAAICGWNAFVNVMIPKGLGRKHLSEAEMACYRQPFPTPESRLPTAIFPRELLRSRRWLSEVCRGLQSFADYPALILWGDRDIAFRSSERERFEALFSRHQTHVLAGAGHFVQEDAPTEIVWHTIRWLRTQRSPENK